MEYNGADIMLVIIVMLGLVYLIELVLDYDMQKNSLANTLANDLQKQSSTACYQKPTAIKAAVPLTHSS